MTRPRNVAALLAGLTAVFAFRVAGQAWVAFPGAFPRPPAWWLPMEAWFSGLIVYPVLLTGQLVLLALQAVHVVIWWCRPEPVTPRPRRAFWLTWFAAGYAVSMAVRYGVAIALRGGWGEPWWAGGLIPVVFHLGLAGYVVVWAAAWRGPEAPDAERLPPQVFPKA